MRSLVLLFMSLPSILGFAQHPLSHLSLLDPSSILKMTNPGNTDTETSSFDANFEYQSPFSPNHPVASYQQNITDMNPASSGSRRTTVFPRTGFFACFFGLSPIHDDYHNNNQAIGSVLRAAIVLFFWLFVSHAPFQLVANLAAQGLQQLEIFNYGNGVVPWYGIDPMLRVSTTISDSLRIVFWIVVGSWYKERVDKEGITNHGEEQGSASLIQSAASTTPSIVSPSKAAPTLSTYDYYPSIDSNDASNNEPYDKNSSQQHTCWPNRQWLRLVLWSTLAGPIRMGDTFVSAGVFESFWTPLVAYSVSRVAALRIGCIPNCVGGIPSLTTSLGLGMLYAANRETFERNVEKKSALPLPDDGRNLHRIDTEVSVRNSSWVYKLRTVLGYAYFTCFMVIWDAQVLDSVLEEEETS